MGLSRPSTSGRAAIHRLISTVQAAHTLLAAFSAPHDVDGRDKPGHDGGEGVVRASASRGCGKAQKLPGEDVPSFLANAHRTAVGLSRPSTSRGAAEQPGRASGLHRAQTTVDCDAARRGWPGLRPAMTVERGRPLINRRTSPAMTLVGGVVRVSGGAVALCSRGRAGSRVPRWGSRRRGGPWWRWSAGGAPLPAAREARYSP